jgi:hypothetical protein
VTKPDDPVMINLRERLCVLSNGEVIPITNMFDCTGDETDEPEEATAFVAGPTPDDKWIVDHVDAYNGVRS